jgi:hypothetical protein
VHITSGATKNATISWQWASCGVFWPAIGTVECEAPSDNDVPG